MEEYAPFSGLKVVDLSQGIAGPYSAMLLAQHGADVVKVEPPSGDWSRVLGRKYDGQTAFSVVGNLGKRSLTLDLKSPRGKDILVRLIRDADVFIESFRPGVIASLGFGYEAVSAIRDDIIYLSVSGFGQTGPNSQLPAMDSVLQAFTGLMASNRGNDGIPHRVGPIFIDVGTGLYCFQALSAALYAKQVGHIKGRYIEASLMEAGAALQAVSILASHLEGGQPQPGLTPSGIFRTRDGWIQMLIYRDAEFPALCEILDLPELRDDPRFATNDLRHRNAAALMPALNAAFARRTSEECAQRLARARILHQKVNDYLEYIDDAHVRESGAVRWIEQEGMGAVPLPRIPGLPPRAYAGALGKAPRPGEHSVEILRGLGYGDRDISDLAAAGIVRADRAAASAG